MNKRKLASGAVSIALAVTMLSTTAFAAAASFTDVDANHWAAPSITEMADRGVMTGVGNNQFAPDKTLTYAEFITMVVRQFYEEKLGDGGDTWYAPYMAVAESIGILTGTNVSAMAAINRYDMAQIMYNVMKEQKMSTSSLSDTSKVADWSSIPASYQGAVSVCYNMGMLAGTDSKGTFNGNGAMTRAQAAVVMDRLIGDEQASIPDVPLGGIPAGALALTGDNTKLSFGEFQADGSIKLDCDGMDGTGGYIKFTNSGYSTLTFTVTVRDKDHEITVGGVDSLTTSDRRFYSLQEAGTTETYAVDITGAHSISMRVFYGFTCDAVVSNIYLS